eukprot:jgi/Tetstr1/445541/TSEL_033315.t1
MGWSLSPYYLCSFTAVFNRHLRRPDFKASTDIPTKASCLGPVQRLEHLGMDFDSQNGRAHYFLFLAIQPARFYLHELHDVLRTKGSWNIQDDAPALLRELEWWAGVPTDSDGRFIYKPVETVYMHVDNSNYGWVFNETTGFLLADRLNREIDYDYWVFNLRHCSHLDNIWGHPTIDRFATMENAWHPRYKSRWRALPCSEATDGMRLSDDASSREHIWCPSMGLFDDLVLKLHTAGVAATAIVL